MLKLFPACAKTCKYQGYSEVEVSKFLATVCIKEYFLITNQICKVL